MAASSVYSSAPMPLYNIQRNDLLNQNYQVPVNDGSLVGSASEDPSGPYAEAQAPTFQYTPPFQQRNDVSYFQPPQMGFPPIFPFPTNVVTNNGGIVPTFQQYIGLPHFQTPAPSFTTAPSFASSSSSSTSPQHPLTPSLIPLPKKVQKASVKSNSKEKCGKRTTAQTAKWELLAAKPKRKRGPNRRPPGMAFSNLLDGLPVEVRAALEQDYKGCCDLVNIKDVSTKQKHMFSKHHCKNLPYEFQELVPNFVCPAFIAFKSNCKAKVGRFDSTDRHCKSCVGYEQMNKGASGASPVVITGSQYDALQKYRETHKTSNGEIRATDQPTEQADDDHVRMIGVLEDIFKGRFPDWLPTIDLWGESTDPEVIVNASAHARAQPPINTTPVSIPASNHFEQPSQPSLYVSSPLDSESPNESAEAFQDGFPLINHELVSNVAIAHATPPLPTDPASVSIPAANHLELPPPCGTSLFDPETAHACAETFMHGFPAANHEDEANVCDPILDATAHPLTMSAPLFVENHVGQTSFYEPPTFDPENVKEWGSYFTNCSQN